MGWLQFSDHWSSSSTTRGWSRWNAYYFCSHCNFCYTTTLAACRIFYLPYFNLLYTHKGLVLLCAPPRHRAMWLNFLAQGKSLQPAGIELGTFGLQRQRFESATLATTPARQMDDIVRLAPCNSALSIHISICKNYAAKYDSAVNISKSYYSSRVDPRLWCHLSNHGLQIWLTNYSCQKLIIPSWILDYRVTTVIHKSKKLIAII